MSKFLKYFNKKYQTNQKIRFKLTQIQKNLLIILSKGYTLKEIAIITNKKHNNIKKQVFNLYKKFGVNSRLELIKKIVSLNLISTKDIKPRFRKRFIKNSETNKTKFNIKINLTLTEIKYLKLVANGKTQNEIVKIMKLNNLYSALVIKYNILNQLNCKNITEAIFVAKKNEVI